MPATTNPPTISDPDQTTTAHNNALRAANTQLSASSAPAEEPKDPRWFWLTVAQNVLIFAVTITFVYTLANGISDVRQLADKDVARGLITFVIAIGTVAIAIMMAVTAMVTRDFDKRIAAGKEVLAILVGVLGTIVGFYYGATLKTDLPQPGATTPAAQISSTPVELTPERVQSNATVTLNTKLSGGTPPYRYGIKFTPETIPAIENQESPLGEINQQFRATVPAGTEIIFRIEGKDRNGVAFAINKEGKQKITVR
jgi:hypothetical protein